MRAEVAPGERSREINGIGWGAASDGTATMGETGATACLVFKESKARLVPKGLPVHLGRRGLRDPQALQVLLAQDMVPGREITNYLQTSPGASLGDKTVLVCHVRTILGWVGF